MSSLAFILVEAQIQLSVRTFDAQPVTWPPLFIPCPSCNQVLTFHLRIGIEIVGYSIC
jgi:hypothetical protein